MDFKLNRQQSRKFVQFQPILKLPRGQTNIQRLIERQSLQSPKQTSLREFNFYTNEKITRQAFYNNQQGNDKKLIIGNCSNKIKSDRPYTSNIQISNNKNYIDLNVNPKIRSKSCFCEECGRRAQKHTKFEGQFIQFQSKYKQHQRIQYLFSVLRKDLFIISKDQFWKNRNKKQTNKSLFSIMKSMSSVSQIEGPQNKKMAFMDLIPSLKCISPQKLSQNASPSALSKRELFISQQQEKQFFQNKLFIKNIYNNEIKKKPILESYLQSKLNKNSNTKNQQANSDSKLPQKQITLYSDLIYPSIVKTPQSKSLNLKSVQYKMVRPKSLFIHMKTNFNNDVGTINRDSSQIDGLNFIKHKRNISEQIKNGSKTERSKTYHNEKVRLMKQMIKFKS